MWSWSEARRCRSAAPAGRLRRVPPRLGATCPFWARALQPAGRLRATGALRLRRCAGCSQRARARPPWRRLVTPRRPRYPRGLKLAVAAQVEDLADAVARLDLTWRWVCSMGAAERAATLESVRRAAWRASRMRATADWRALPLIRWMGFGSSCRRGYRNDVTPPRVLWLCPCSCIGHMRGLCDGCATLETLALDSE